MPYLGPKYPVVKADPSMDDCIRALRFQDYFEAAAITGASWIYGYISGKPVRFNSAHTAGVLGFTAGCMVCIINTRNRFVGSVENAREVKLYGLDPNAVQPVVYPPQDPRFPTALPYPPSRVDWTSYK